MAFSISEIGLLALFLSTVIANNCSITPIYVDFHDRRVDGGIAFEYGLFVGLGTPSTNMSLWPALALNETTVADISYCADGVGSQCFNHSHGYFDVTNSSTFRPDLDYQRLDSSDPAGADIIATGTDTYNIFTHYFDPSPPNVTHVDDVPITILTNYNSSNDPWFGPAGQFGLGPSSTILRRLFDLNLISSRSFGLYIGTYYERAAGRINGSLTLGGYDSGKFTGTPRKYELSRPSTTTETPFRVQVSGITLTTVNGNSTRLAGSDFEAYLTTSQFPLTLPQSTTEDFISRTSAIPSNNDDNSLALPPNFNGTLTISLSTGLNVTLSSEELRNVSNISPISALPSINSSSSSSGPFLLGTAFLAHIYLMTNYDSTPPEFFLAEVLPHAPYIFTETLCANDDPVAYRPIQISSFKRNGIPGAIVGGVVGGIGLTVLMWWVVFKTLERKRMKNSDSLVGVGGGVMGGKKRWSGDGDEEAATAAMAGKGDGDADGEVVDMRDLTPTGKEMYRDDEDVDARHSTHGTVGGGGGGGGAVAAAMTRRSHDESYSDVPVTPASATKGTVISGHQDYDPTEDAERVSLTRNSSVSSMGEVSYGVGDRVSITRLDR